MFPCKNCSYNKVLLKAHRSLNILGFWMTKLLPALFCSLLYWEIYSWKRNQGFNKKSSFQCKCCMSDFLNTSFSEKVFFLSIGFPQYVSSPSEWTSQLTSSFRTSHRQKKQGNPELLFTTRIKALSPALFNTVSFWLSAILKFLSCKSVFFKIQMYFSERFANYCLTITIQ